MDELSKLPYLDHWLTIARQTPLAILADLDGTLIPFAPTPGEARVSPELAQLLTEIAGLPGVLLAVVSGRPRETLERMVSAVSGAYLVAEHGGWRRGPGAWEAAVDGLPQDMAPLVEEFEKLASRYAGAIVERKTWSLTLHYRQVAASDRDGLLVAASSLLEKLRTEYPGFERLDGAEMLEIRSGRMRKSLAVPWLRERAGADARVVALGDDLTDEDMFGALGVGDESILVARRIRRTKARWRLLDSEGVENFLRWLAGVRKGELSEPEDLPEPIVPHASRQRLPARSAHDLLVVSNRLPDLRAATTPSDGRRRNVGGLVSAVQPALSARRGLWLGWSGRRLPEHDFTGEVGLDDDSQPALAWVDFSDTWYRNYYNGFCNGALWPLFHSFPARAQFNDAEWDCYVKVNEAFAVAAAELVGPDTPVWIHDYHLLLAARWLRQRGHRGPIGLFLHVPFPSLDLFSLLPWAEQILDAMLDFDLLGFHTMAYVENFRHCVGALSPAQVSDDVVRHRGRRIRMRAFPIGIVPEGFQEPVEPSIAEEVAGLLRAIAPSRLVLGVDRLDYTKGIPERLQAFGRMLELFPEWRGKVSLVQISVPSRADVPEYVEQRSRIENIVGRLSGEYGEAAWVPVRYLYRSYNHAQLAELYRAAAVGYVTPLRDGMNLVAKEFVAAQDPANPGVLLLSKFAGAAAELKDAIQTNPWHADGMARDLDRALRMELVERQERHGKLLAVVSRTTATTWAEDFLRALEDCRT